ncbi:lamin-like protein [Punica granatum]|uniref:Phytocyanin domain-containing protein n=2 Tax=Punica granatum TaxID=22663 RepID=A0A218WPI9_PUNGR|nr:lamin-like protein [Punica granatum]OWM74777.1 hypothetical protein CDL15_Pgr004544 [Punica granatum]PKI38727.1 hypothetical protein CRG98_040840 [Punica granatum]
MISRLAATLVALVVVAESAVGRAALVKVGGPPGWVPNTNYTDWASHQQFHVGDWLNFVFDKYQYDVLEVNKTVYETCNSEAGFITNVTRGGRDVFQLTQPRTYYFLCSRGFCWGGMKVAISVQEPPPPVPAPAKSTATSSARPSLLLTVAALSFFSNPFFSM